MGGAVSYERGAVLQDQEYVDISDVEIDFEEYKRLRVSLTSRLGSNTEAKQTHTHN